MTIILFLVDTSASMNQRTYLGTTLLDIAKAAVENFMKIRGRDPNSRWDRYMLLTFEDPPANIKAGWKESAGTFTAELKNLKAGGLTSMGASIKNALDLLNIFRMQSGVDTYGHGRSPFYLESAVIIVITDGGALTTPSSVLNEMTLPMREPAPPGSELTKEPFRWDQRIFALVLRLPASVPQDTFPPHIPAADNCPIDSMCEVTGGRSYAVSNQKMITAALESLVQKVQTGVVLYFEKFGPDPPEGPKTENGEPNGSSKENQDSNKQNVDPFLEKGVPSPMAPQPPLNNTAWQACRRLIYVPRSASKGQFTGHWPMPEAFWPDSNLPALTPRLAHPVVGFSCAPSDPMVIENIPFDKYELEPSPLTHYILSRRQPNVCWQTFMANSGRCDQSFPFGYLKASTSLTTVNLFVMPYNYPILLPLLEELFKVHKLKPNQLWRERFDKYLKQMPGYYAPSLRRVLAKFGAPNLVYESMENCLSYPVISHLKKLKNQAKVEMDRLNASVGQKLSMGEGIAVSSRTKTSILQRRDFSQLLSTIGGNLSALKQEIVSDYSGFHIAVPDPAVRPQYYRNPYDIPRKNLLDQVTRMRQNVLEMSHTAQTLMEQEERHNVPVQQMGNYQELVKKLPAPLRPIDNQPARLHTFGNPFKVNKQNMMVDEAEDALFGNQSLKRKAPETPMSPGPDRKRKPGPLPRNVPYKVLASPCPSPSYDNYYPSDEENASDDGENRLTIDDSSDEESTESKGSSRLSPPSSSPPAASAGGVNHHSPPSHLANHNHSGEGLYRLGSNDRNHVNLNSTGREGNSNKEVWKYNSQLRVKVCKEVKKPGKDFSTLFRYLSTVRGSLDMRRSFLRSIAQEAQRFKRQGLVSQLQQFEDNMVRVDGRSRARSCVS
ncbi:hypothetical protein ACOMHN_028915 [Nucella lapillus]